MLKLTQLDIENVRKSKLPIEVLPSVVVHRIIPIGGFSSGHRQSR